MKPSKLKSGDDHSDSPSADLARRLARYRSRVEAEGRKRSLKVIDRAIDDAREEGSANPDQAPDKP